MSLRLLLMWAGLGGGGCQRGSHRRDRKYESAHRNEKRRLRTERPSTGASVMWVCAGPPSSFPAQCSLDLLMLLMVCGFWITRTLKYVFHRCSLRRPRNMSSFFFKGIAPRWLQCKTLYVYFGVLWNEIHQGKMPPSFIIVNFCF